MRILVFGINYAPELTGIGKYTGEMCAWLASRGHEVAVITAPPYYPEWEISPAYMGKRWHREKLDGVTVYRVPLYVPKKVTSKKRIIHEFSFLGGVFPRWFAFLLRKKYDVVININPPFHLGSFAMLYAKFKGAKLITHIQDLQIDAAKDLGMIKNEILLGLMFKSERYILKRSDAVSSISLGMKKKIIAKGVPEKKYFMFPNWVDAGIIRPLPKEESLRKEWNIPLTDQVILYSGNLGEKQGLEIIIDAAEHFKRQENVRFIIVGTGGAKDRLQQLAETKALHNVFFYPLQAYEKLSALLATADIHLVLQKKSASDLVMPSKLTGILAAGGCSLVTALPDTSLYEVIADDQLGFLVEPESLSSLITGLNSMLTSDLRGYRTRARKYAIDKLSKDKIMLSFEKRLMNLCKEKVK